MAIVHFFRTPALSEALVRSLVERFPSVKSLKTEFCYNVESEGDLSDDELAKLRWLLCETFEPGNFSEKAFLSGNAIELGPRMSFQTAWSTNAVSICQAVGLKKITRLERSRRYQVEGALEGDERAAFIAACHDRMTECLYPAPLTSFDPGAKAEPVRIIPVMEEGRAALEALNREMGLGLDDWDVDYYHNLFANVMRRNPTNVECFDLGQSNSEHSRHWFFKGRLVIDNEEMPQNLMQIVAAPIEKNPSNSTIAFKDNSSAIKGGRMRTILPSVPGQPSAFVEAEVDYDVLLTAETHNFPSGVAPFPGAETGTGGRIRDVQGVGRGGLVVAGTAAYCVGNLNIPGYRMPWEHPEGDNSEYAFDYPPNLASPLTIEIEASNGASDYGNKFGEPLIQGYTRSFGLRLPSGERREWIKPIMFTGGIGQMSALHREKDRPAPGMLITKIGGPAYRIGMGGGAASSMVQGENAEELDFNAVQRGDAEMEQKMNRVVRACVEMGPNNPIVSIHDQGAGGNCNVLKELVDPEGGRINLRSIILGDRTLSVLEIWGAEYQENNALLIRPESADEFRALCEREKVPFAFLGEVTGDGRVVLYDEADGSTPVDLELKHVLAKMPQKTFNIRRERPVLMPIRVPQDTTVKSALERVLRLVSVGSKRFLTNKVDRSVTGLIAQQQCAGPLQLTVSDVAVIAQSHFGLTGAATAIGEQPIKGLVDAAAMARMSVAEALTNIVWANLTGIGDIKCSANWMWAAKLPGEGALIYDAANAMADLMSELGIAVDGGKDSLSMAAVIKETKETVKAPGALVISAYCTVRDITKTVTPDIKRPGHSHLMYIDLGGGKCRTGGSALAHVFSQIGSESPDIEDPTELLSALVAVQELVERGLVLAGHDVSDGGLITTLLEMAFAGNCGLEVDITSASGALSTLFAEEAGLVFEFMPEHESIVREVLEAGDVAAQCIGRTTIEPNVRVAVNLENVLSAGMRELRAAWEETSFRLERLQMNPECAHAENSNIFDRKGPAFELSFVPEAPQPPRERFPVAIIRQEGSNGDREMTSAFYTAGFEPWDVMMSDLLEGRITLERFRGVVFVGGFSYADVMDSAKGWAGTINFNDNLRAQFDAFYARRDTFSLGVCNGCQLMALLGWVPWRGIENHLQPRFIHNSSGRFESRFSTVRIMKSPSIMLKGMEGSTLGVWVAHGEGKYHFLDQATHKRVIDEHLAPVRYADDNGQPTEAYPFNPNGSPEGITALCSPDGRHLAMMPHPERAFLKWQWPWMPEQWHHELEASPWLRMFVNARLWCEENR